MSKKFSDLKRKEIRRELSDGVVIYNPSSEMKKKILEIITKNTKGSDIYLNGETILLDLIPILSNVKFDLDRELDKEKIESILDDPDELLQDMVKEIKIITSKISKDAIEIINDLSKKPKEEITKLINTYVEESKTEEQKKKDKKIEELRNRIKELENA